MVKKFLYSFFILVLFLGSAIFFIRKINLLQSKELETAKRISIIAGQDMEENTHSSISMSDNIFKETFVDPFLKNQYFEGVFRDSAVLGFQKSETSLLLSEKEIFSRIWPEDYIKYLRDLEDLMRKDNYLATEEAILLDSDETIFSFLGEVVNYARQNNWIKPEDAKNLEKGLRDVLPVILNQERDALRKNISRKSIVPGDQDLFPGENKENNAKNIIDSILNGLKYVILQARPAFAQGWVALDVICYKDLNPLYLVPGFNLFSFCCNCGIRCVPTACVFIPNCGPFSIFCDIPLGCLNKVCAAWPNAIWDPLTGICGCG